MNEQVEAEPKKAGRPPKAQAPLKKGNSSWQPASLNEFTNKEPGFRYRMSRKDANNLSKKSQEHWETVSDLNGAKTKHIGSGRMDDGASLSSVQEGHDWVLQRIPEEIAQSRDDWHNAETARRTSGLTAHVKKDLAKEGARTHGSITISSLKGDQIIE